MTTNTPTHTPHTQTSTVIVEHEGARTIARAEATALLREGLALTHKRLDTALRLALDTPHTWWQLRADEPAMAFGAVSRDRELISLLRQQRNAFLPRFQTVFDEAFQQRVQGQTRAAKRRGSNTYELSLVDDTDLTGQVALKNVIRAMHDASKDEMYALNFRVRLLLREAPDGTPFDNPWGPDYLCDAFGVVCRDLWKDLKVWRPIMEQLIRFMTPHAVKLYRDINGFLQDHDVLPTLRVRLRAREGEPREAVQAGSSLYSSLYQLMNPGAPATGFGGTVLGGAFGAGGYGIPAGYDPWGGQASAPGAPQPLRSALQGALDSLQQGHSEALAQFGGRIDAYALQQGSANIVPQVKAALGDQMTANERITLDIVGGLFEYLFQDPSLADAMKTVFGQLQIPVLKAALLDARMFTDVAHPARAFIDRLAEATAGLDPQREDDRELLHLARRLAHYVRDQFTDDLKVFQGAKLELDGFLDQERPRIAARVSEAVDPLLHEDAHAAARAEVEPELAARLVGKSVPLAIRAFLENEWLERLATVYREHGPNSEVWKSELATLSDLLWSLTPKVNADDRKRLAQVVPKLVQVFNLGQPVGSASEPRRKAFLACMFMRHLTALRGTGETAPDPNVKTGKAATQDDGDSDQFDDQVTELVRGDWVEFHDATDGRRTLAKLAWRSPQRTRLLFTYRNGAVASTHTPSALAEEFRAGRAKLALEAAPLFERALTQLIARYTKPAPNAVNPL